MSKNFDNSEAVNDNEHEDTQDPVKPYPWRAAVRAVQRYIEMSEGPRKGRGPDQAAETSTGHGRPRGPAVTGSVETFASQVLSLVAANSQAARGVLRQDLLDDLIAAVQDYDSASRISVLERFRAAGIRPATIIDRYLPEAARELGAAWCEDNMSFADVTIGSARLQSMLRDLRAPQVTDPAALSVLIVVPQDAYHTLGATVVADQLRRLGVAPRTAMGIAPLDLAELVESHDFNAVMISAATSERLETLRELVNCVRAASRAPVPIIVGGTVTEKDTDIRTLTGADYVSNNPEEALQACGLMTPTHAVEPPGPQG
ncbi:MAG: cobalamin B12-binding domain-containing protein [Pseudomonadota bacterium]